MVKKKPARQKGKISFSRYFQEFKEGDMVAIVRELAIKAGFPARMQGRTGVVEEKRGRAYSVKVKDQNKEKRFVIRPIHLKKIKALN